MLNCYGCVFIQLNFFSGGKDSCFNLMHCEANGHEIVAVANLCPRPQANGAGERGSSFAALWALIWSRGNG